jgi:hypothetical protein
MTSTIKLAVWRWALNQAVLGGVIDCWNANDGLCVGRCATCIQQICSGSETDDLPRRQYQLEVVAGF